MAHVIASLPEQDLPNLARDVPHTRIVRLVGSALVLALVACDPVYSLQVNVRVTPAAQAAVPQYPAHVLVYTEKVYNDPDARPDSPGPYLLGVLCRASDETLVLTAGFGGVGCSIETAVTAYLAPAPTETRCGPRESYETVHDAPLPDAAIIKASARAFVGTTMHDCSGQRARIELQLTEP